MVLHHIGRSGYTNLNGFYSRQGMEDKADETKWKAVRLFEQVCRKFPRSEAAAESYFVASAVYKSLDRRDKELECRKDS